MGGEGFFLQAKELTARVKARSEDGNDLPPTVTWVRVWSSRLYTRALLSISIRSLASPRSTKEAATSDCESTNKTIPSSSTSSLSLPDRYNHITTGKR